MARATRITYWRVTVIETFFLPKTQWDRYSEWLTSLDSETLGSYFGFSVTPESIYPLIAKMKANSADHFLLVGSKAGHWAGTIHIATEGDTVELGVIVARPYRHLGIASIMMDEALVWSRNRQYKKLFMHCISWNYLIRRLCEKFDLRPKKVLEDSEVQMQLKPPNGYTLFKEWQIWHKNCLFFDFFRFYRTY